jgi:hypothetical protein
MNMPISVPPPDFFFAGWRLRGFISRLMGFLTWIPDS